VPEGQIGGCERFATNCDRSDPVNQVRVGYLTVWFGRRSINRIDDRPYYATYEYSPKRFLLLKALVAQTIGSNDGAQSYDRGTKGLVQVGVTF
jgi:hypothetical protein